MSEHTHCRWQLDKGSWISNDVKDENRSVWVLESDYLNMKESLEAENARIKSEVERLTKQNALATPRHLIASQDIKTLREQVERLTKAGDELERVLTSHMSSYEVGNASHEWRVAKGVQS